MAGAGIAASQSEILVTWLEQRSGTHGGPPDWKELVEYSRAFDTTKLAPKAAAKEIAAQGSPDAFVNGVAPYADDTNVGVAQCNWAAFAGNLDCSVSASDKTSTFHEREAGPGPQKDQLAVVKIGTDAIVVIPQCHDVRAFATARSTSTFIAADGTRRSEEDRMACGDSKDVDKVGVAKLGADHAFAIWRRGIAIEGRELDKTAKTIGGIVQLSAPGAASGKPAILSLGTEVIVSFAARTKPTDPWKLVFARWKSGVGAAVTRTTIETGTEPAMAPSLARTSDPNCVLLSWTEGTGKTTTALAAHVCGDAIVAASRVALSPAGTEAGDTALAFDPNGAVAVWQELPGNKGAAELHFSRISCH